MGKLFHNYFLVNESERINPESREKEYIIDHNVQPFTYKPENPMELPEGVLEIHKAFADTETLSDIESELKKTKPNDNLYHLDKVFGKDKLIKIDQKVRNQIKITKSKLYVVGGAVRDFLLNIFHPDKLHKTPKNYNLATNARPKIVMLILLNHDIKCKLKSLGVVEADVDGTKYEIETFREGENKDSVTYSTPQRDAKRRDFRINSLRYDIDKQVVEDDVGGFGDLVEKPPKLRLNDPEAFNKDPHVALRAMRLHGKINGGNFDHLDSDMKSKLTNFDMGSKVDRKRARDEFVEGLKVADDQSKYISCYAKCGKEGKSLLQQMFPGLEVNAKFPAPNNTHPHVALALILKDNAPDKAASLLEKAGFDHDEIVDVVFLLGLSRYRSADQVDEFFHAYNKAKKLVPSAIKNYVKWANLTNKNIINKLLDHKKSGGPFLSQSPLSDIAPDKAIVPDESDFERIYKLTKKMV